MSNILNIRSLRDTQQKHERMDYLDSLRGLASIAVLLWHNFLAFFPGAVTSGPYHARFLEKHLYHSPFAVLFAGDFAVFVFFALSGFVLSIGHFKKNFSANLTSHFFKRYVRLMPPAFFSVMVAYFIILFGWKYNFIVAQEDSSWWLALMWKNVSTNMLDAINYGLIHIWFSPVGADASYNSNLGTLYVELMGSFGIFLVLMLIQYFSVNFKSRLCLYPIILVIVCYLSGGYDYFSFFCGLILADLYVNKPGFFKINLFCCWGICAFAIYLGSINIGNLPTYNHYIDPLFRSMGFHPLSAPWSFGAVVLLYVVLSTDKLKYLLQNHVLVKAGEYSFALYICHTIFLCSVTCYAFLYFTKHFSYNISVLLSFSLTLPLLLIFVWLVRKVDIWAVNVSRKL